MLKTVSPDFEIAPPEALLVDCAQLARMLGMSKKWVQKHANRLAGSLKVGKMRRFNVEIIRKRVSLGQNLLV